MIRKASNYQEETEQSQRRRVSMGMLTRKDWDVQPYRAVWPRKHRIIRRAPSDQEIAISWDDESDLMRTILSSQNGTNLPRRRATKK